MTQEEFERITKLLAEAAAELEGGVQTMFANYRVKVGGILRQFEKAYAAEQAITSQALAAYEREVVKLEKGVGSVGESFPVVSDGGATHVHIPPEYVVPGFVPKSEVDAKLGAMAGKRGEPLSLPARFTTGVRLMVPLAGLFQHGGLESAWLGFRLAEAGFDVTQPYHHQRVIDVDCEEFWQLLPPPGGAA